MKNDFFAWLNNFQLKAGFLLAGGIILVTSLLAANLVSLKINLILGDKVAQLKEAARPADLELISIKANGCADCFDLKQVIDLLKKENVNVTSEKELDFNSEEATALIAQFKVTKVPVLLIKGELDKDENIKKLLSNTGEIIEKTFVLRQVAAPYVLIPSGDVRGRVQLMMITDKNCLECYDVTAHEAILSRMGLPIQNGNSQVVERSSVDGKKIISQYKIKLLPTFVLTGDLETFPALVKVWPQVGTIEKDGAYVFRQGVALMGAYKDLTTNKIIKPENKTE